MLKLELPVLVRAVGWGVEVAPTLAEKKSRAGTSFTWPAVRVRVASANLVVSSTETAVSETVGLAGTVAGAV